MIAVVLLAAGRPPAAVDREAAELERRLWLPAGKGRVIIMTGERRDKVNRRISERASGGAPAAPPTWGAWRQ